MTNFVVLNRQEHANLRVIREHGAQFGDAVKFAMTFPFEFRNIQGCYPIFFSKNSETGKYFPLALFGLEGDENLFLSESGWDADYIPLMIRRHPFLIGFQPDRENPDQQMPIVSIDMDNPRISEDQGEPLFLEHGGTTDFLQEATGNLELIHQGHQMNDRFSDVLQQYDLLEAFTLDIELGEDTSKQLLGYYTVKEEALQKLKADALEDLNNQGFLQPLFMVIASHSRLKKLIELKLSTMSSVA
jgi:hypothetical protein